MSLLSEWELWACAQHYVTQHGEDAAVIAAMRCDELLKASDFERGPQFSGNDRAHQQAARPTLGTAALAASKTRRSDP